MRAYILLFALVLLPHLVLSQRPISRASFVRRTRSSPKFAHSPRHQLRFSRYIQEPELQEVQQKNTDNVDSEEDVQQQLIDNFGPEKSTKSVGYTAQTPLFETSTARPVQQVKDEVEDILPQLNHPLSDFEDGELSQNYLSSQDNSYSPVKQQKERGPQKISPLSNGGNGYAPSNGGNGYAPSNGGNGYAPANGGNGYAPSNGGNGYSPSNGYSAGAGYSGGSGPGYSGGSGYSGREEALGFEEDINSADALKTSIRGEAGKDYPVFASVPSTSFKCSQQQFPGYYADIDAQCQVFHICQADGRSNAFLCPNGTIFSQRHFVCVWWYEFDCSTAEQFYDLNAELYKESPVKQNGIVGGSVPYGGNGIVGGSVPLGRNGVVGGSVPSLGRNGIVGGSVPSLSRNGIVGGSVPSLNGNNKLSSPKENLNKMYMAQIDEFNGITTAAPLYYGGNGKTTLRSNGNGNGNGFKATTQPIQYDVSSADSVTPSSLDSQYETTPYNLDEALGEEIHSETPLIESLQLTTNLPKNGNGMSSPVDYYGGKMSTMAEFAFGNNQGTSPKPTYAGVKGAVKKPNGKTSPPKISQVPEAPVKSAQRNGGVKSKPVTYNGNGSAQKTKSNGNGYKPSYSAYGGFKQ